MGALLRSQHFATWVFRAQAQGGRTPAFAGQACVGRGVKPIAG
jgi:hypothetical protein